MRDCGGWKTERHQLVFHKPYSNSQSSRTQLPQSPVEKTHFDGIGGPLLDKTGQVAGDLAALAAILDAQDKHEEAEELYQRALHIFESQLGQESYAVAINLNNLAALHYRRGNSLLAEAFYWWALHLKEKILGPRHPDTAMTLNNLAVLFRAQGQLEQAAPLFRRALDIFENTLDPDHPSVLMCRANYEELQQEISKA